MPGRRDSRDSPVTLTPVSIIQHRQVVSERHAAVIHPDSYVHRDQSVYDWTVSVGDLQHRNSISLIQLRINKIHI